MDYGMIYPRPTHHTDCTCRPYPSPCTCPLHSAMECPVSHAANGVPNPYDEIEMYMKMAKDDILAAWASTTPYSREIFLPSEVKDKVATPLIESCTSPSKGRKSYKYSRSPTRCKVSPKSPKERRKTFHHSPRKQFSHRYGEKRSLQKDFRLQEWSQGLLKDFQVLVQEEIKALSTPPSYRKTESSPPKVEGYTSTGRLSSVEGFQIPGTRWSLQDRLDDVSKTYLASTVEKNNNNYNAPEVVCHASKLTSGTSLSRQVPPPSASSMGTNQSVLRDSEEWVDDFAPFKTYTLPRSNQRSISFVGERLSATHPDDKNDNCRLLRVTQHRFSRSHSLDEGTVLSPWAVHHLRMIDEIHHHGEDQIPYSPDPGNDPSLTEGVYGRIRKAGVSQADNEKWENAMISEELVLKQEYDERNSKRLSNGWSSHGKDYLSAETSPRERRRSSAGSCSSALTVEALSHHDAEEWRWADDDAASSLTDRVCNEGCEHCKKLLCQNASRTLRPDIIVTSDFFPTVENEVDDERSYAFETNGQDEHEVRDSFLETSWTKPEIVGRNGADSGRKSEPILPSRSMVPPSPLLDIPGLEVRRHTLPNSPNKNGGLNCSLEIGTPVFNTLSWETLPPAEEMEVMEVKPIQLKKDEEEEDEPSPKRPSIPRSKSLSSIRSLNSSLSSLSHLSTHDDFSECEMWASESHLPKFSSRYGDEDTTEPLLENGNFTPDVFLDPADAYLRSSGCDEDDVRTFSSNVIAFDEWNCNSSNDVFVDTTPIIIKLSPKVFKGDQMSPETFSVEKYQNGGSNLSMVNHHLATRQSNMMTSTPKDYSHDDSSSTPTVNQSNGKRVNSDLLEPITGVLQLTPSSRKNSRNEIIFSVTIPERKESSTQCVPIESNHNSVPDSDSCKETLDRRKNGSPPIAEQEHKRIKESKSVNSILSEMEDPHDCSKVHGKNNNRRKNMKLDLVNGDVIMRSKASSLHLEKKKRNSKGCCSAYTDKTFADLQHFLKEVETRIPPSEPPVPCCGSNDSMLSPGVTSSVASHSSGDLFSFSPSLPTIVMDASTQTSPLVTPPCGSPTSSFTWYSECECDSVSLEPCASSVALSEPEDDLDEEDECDDDEDDWWIAEGSMSSSPPITPASPTRDDSSLSLSESLDNLDQNVESGIGTVSTRPSASPPVQSGTLDLSGSNLSSEDTGLETSFERRVRRYLPNAKGASANAKGASANAKGATAKASNHSLYNRRRKPRLRQADHWVKRESHSTQTEVPNYSEDKETVPELSRDLRAASEEARHSWKNADTKDISNQLVRHTCSEPRLAEPSNHNLRVVSSEATLPPLPRVHSRSFCGPPLLPTLSEDSSIGKGHHQNRPRFLSIGEVQWPSKATSAPALEKKKSRSFRITPDVTPEEPSKLKQFPPKRTQSAKEISEIEALEACKWLRAAGFPQYAQMYEDYQFPLDLGSVERDHSFLDVDSLQALFRRLRVLNRCAKIRLDSTKKSNADDSDDEEQQCALSGNWQFQRHSRRWSRIDTMRIQLPGGKTPVDLRASGSDRVRGHSDGSDEANLAHFKRSGSERLKDGAKALLRRMESLKNKKKRRHRDGIVISSPKVLDEAFMQVRMAELGCVDISPDASPEMKSREKNPLRDTTSLHMQETRQTTPGEDSSSLASDQSLSSTPRFRSRRRKRFWRRGISGDEVVVGVGSAYSDSECSPPTWRHCISTDDNFNPKLRSFAKDRTSPSPERFLDHFVGLDRPRRPNLRHTTSLTYGKESEKARDNFISSLRGSSKGDGTPLPSPDSDNRHSIYDNVPLIICNKSYHDFHHHQDGADVDMVMNPEGSGSSECTMESRESPLPSAHDDEDGEERPIRRRGTIDRWHSFNRKSHSFTTFRQLGTQISGFSVGQMNHLRKRALLKLTALMERHCPTNRTAWNWELPKFMRKMKTPDYKDRILFGVPLQVINQRMGQPLPPGIQQALYYLKTNCIDQVGIFRKPGVRSRIQKLRELHESEENIEYASYGPCDIADMVKTYFRELPEVLLTNKLSEIFIHICQYLPTDVRLEALQCVMLMMPDENREVLMTLLSFLSDVSANAHLNQMTASNLAVCMAPSLFHLNMGGSGSSPLRRKAAGTPEQKDLHDNKAAHQCLTLMILEVTNLQCVPTEMLSNCRFSYLDLSQPVALEDLGSASNISLASCNAEGDWASYMNACITSLLKETREKTRGWIHISHPDPLVEVGYRKVGDGHPLRLWKVTTEVEAPPNELLTRVLRERHLWDESLLKWRVVTRLDRQAEVFQYMCNSMLPRSPVDYCVLRCWRTDLGRGICVVVETSVEHSDAPVLIGAIRGIALASRYLIQPCGSGKSRITHISRVDMRGRLPEWYNKNYAHVTANHIVKLRQSFQHFATGPESKV